MQNEKLLKLADFFANEKEIGGEISVVRKCHSYMDGKYHIKGWIVTWFDESGQDCAVLCASTGDIRLFKKLEAVENLLSDNGIESFKVLTEY
jgi:hypothetical protein